LKKGEKIYFAGDLHLGLPNYKKSRLREKKFVAWLDSIKDDAFEIYLLGDIFDFWFEYKRVVPRGFTRLLGKIAEIADSGVPVYFFTGNHDIWVFDYLPEETGVIVQRKPLIKEIGGKIFFIAHGDGLGNGQFGFKLLKFIFHNKVLQWLFARLHPNFALWMGGLWSAASRDAKGISIPFMGEDKEMMVRFAKETLKNEHFDYFVFGHRHLPIRIKLSDNCEYINLGDWIKTYSYAVFDGEKMEMFRYHK